MPKSKETAAISRRKFAVGAAVAATAVLLPGREAWADDLEPIQSQSDSVAKLSPGARAELESKLKELFRKYGTRLSEEQKADMRKVMAETQEGLEKMRSFALTNGDQPAGVFQLYREGEQK
ncbi:MAG TPA: hypothetical protein VI636_00015 [Candidatus Angelobacter sp.]